MSDVLASRLGIVGATYASLVPLLSFSYKTGEKKKATSENKCVIITDAATGIYLFNSHHSLFYSISIAKI